MLILLMCTLTGSGESGAVSEGGSHKRRHCLYYLAGHCPRGTDCPEYHGVVPDNYDDIEAMVHAYIYNSL